MGLWAQLERATSRQPTGPNLRYHAARALLALALAIVTYSLFPASPVVESPLLEVGSVAPDNVIAPVAFSVPKAPADLARERSEAAATVPPVLSFNTGAQDSALTQLHQFLGDIEKAARPAVNDVQAAEAMLRAAAADGIRLLPAEAMYLANGARRRAMTDAVERVIARWVPVGVAQSGALDGVRGAVTIRHGTDERTVHPDSVPTFANLVVNARRFHPDPQNPTADALYLKLIAAFFHPTLVRDEVETAKRREDAIRSVNPSTYDVRSQEKIVGANEVVSRDQHEKMIALRDALQQRGRGTHAAGRIAGAILFNAIVVALFGIVLGLFRPQLYASYRALLLFAAVFALVTAASSVIAHWTPLRPELIPVAFAAVMFSVLFDPRISIIAVMILSVVIGGQSVYRGTNALFISLIGGVAAAFSVRVVRRRNQAFWSILTIGAAYLLAAIAIGLTLDRSADEIMRSSAWGALNAMVSVSLAMLLLPAAEEITGIDTYLKLLEWSDLNRPLMQRLSLEAPGTYAHTIAMANLAEAACNAIGANGLLARVGTYYHDIGKLKKPQYFVENQPRGRNPHDKLKPGMSASIIRNHIRDGLELAAEHKLPKAIVAFITQHHGTGPITYFLEKAKERDAAPNPGEYAYPGPVPQTQETAVVMLADGVEASTRVLNDPSPEKIRDVIDHIVRMRMEQGQLRDAPLTLRQIEVVKQEFARVLIGMHHGRIDYPASGGGITAEFASA